MTTSGQLTNLTQAKVPDGKSAQCFMECISSLNKEPSFNYENSELSRYFPYQLLFSAESKLFFC